jgi:hypothetical protein
MKDCRTFLRLQGALELNKEHIKEERTEVKDIKSKIMQDI